MVPSPFHLSHPPGADYRRLLSLSPPHMPAKYRPLRQDYNRNSLHRLVFLVLLESQVFSLVLSVCETRRAL